jgi:hypothetical protein
MLRCAVNSLERNSKSLHVSAVAARARSAARPEAVLEPFGAWVQADTITSVTPAPTVAVGFHLVAHSQQLTQVVGYFLGPVTTAAALLAAVKKAIHQGS